jgi:uncharacterized membrane protein
MDLDSAIVLSAKLAALALFVYGLIVFADQGAGELMKRGAAYVVSPYIWDSSFAWPEAGFVAFQGLLMALTGFFVLRLKPKKSDFSSEISYAWPFLRALLDTLILFFALCLTWEVLLSIYEPGTMYMQVIQYLYGTGISNVLVMNFSAIMLAFLSAFKLRSLLFGWLPPRLTPKSFTLGSGFLSLSLGVVIFVIALYSANSLNVVSILTQPHYFSCNEECYFVGTLDLVGMGVGAILALIGAIVSVERLFPRERVL